MSHSQACRDSNRFGDGYDCVCETGLAEALTAANARIAELETARFERAESEAAALRAEVGQLTAQNHRLVGRIDALKADEPDPECDCTALRAEVERLNRGAWARAAEAHLDNLEIAEAKLAAANALLERFAKYWKEDRASSGKSTRLPRLRDEVVVHLSGQPAAPARTEAECMTVTEEPGGPHMPNPAEWERTEAEQRVLDAADAWHDSDINDPDPADEALHAAVMARRGLR